MRAVVQRVKKASVTVGEEIKGQIASGLLVFLGVSREDQEGDADYLADKIVNLRIFEDSAGKMNCSALELAQECLVVSQFTLYGDCRKGRRPSFFAAATPAKADQLYQYFVEQIKKKGLRVATGEFQAMMDVELINDGPVTLLLDSGKGF